MSLLDEAGQPLQLVDMQGGAFSTDGTLLYITNGLDDDCDCGIHVFDVRFESSDPRVRHWIRSVHRAASGSIDKRLRTLQFRYHPGWPYYQEPEGITYWDLDARMHRNDRHDQPRIPLGGQ